MKKQNKKKSSLKEEKSPEFRGGHCTSCINASFGVCRQWGHHIDKESRSGDCSFFELGEIFDNVGFYDFEDDILV